MISRIVEYRRGRAMERNMEMNPPFEGRALVGITFGFGCERVVQIAINDAARIRPADDYLVEIDVIGKVRQFLARFDGGSHFQSRTQAQVADLDAVLTQCANGILWLFKFDCQV